MRDDVGGGVNEGQFEKHALAMTFRQHRQHPLRQTLAFKGIGAQRQMGAVHLDRRARDQHDAPGAIHLVETPLRQRLPTQQRDVAVRLRHVRLLPERPGLGLLCSCPRHAALLAAEDSGMQDGRRSRNLTESDADCQLSRGRSINSVRWTAMVSASHARRPSLSRPSIEPGIARRPAGGFGHRARKEPRSPAIAGRDAGVSAILSRRPWRPTRQSSFTYRAGGQARRRAIGAGPGYAEKVNSFDSLGRRACLHRDPRRSRDILIGNHLLGREEYP